MIVPKRYDAIATSLGILLLGTLLAGCPVKASDVKGTLPSPAPLTSEEKEKQAKLNANGISSAEVDFVFRLLQKAAAKTPDGNAFLSPFSASQAVLLAANGTTETTQAGFLKSVGLPTGDIETVNSNQKALLALLRPPKEKGADGKEVPAYEWTAANAIWSRYAPKAEYVKTCADYLGATAEPLTTAAAINDWADKNTRGRIKDIVTDQVIQNADLVLTNAVYFKGRWINPFTKEETANESFYLPSGTARQQPFMHDTSHNILWYKGKNYEAVSLPYRGGMSMILLLPAKAIRTGAEAKTPKDTTIGEILPALTAAEWKTLRAGLRPSYIALALPKFEINYETSLLKPLTELGMPTGGDFSPVSDKLAASSISEVIQKTFLRVDEKGTEAAAVTTMAFAGAAVPSHDEPHPFIVDRPFLCAIVQDSTGAILFSGVINDPKPIP